VFHQNTTNTVNCANVLKGDGVFSFSSQVPGCEYWVPDVATVWRRVTCLAVVRDGASNGQDQVSGQVVVRDCSHQARVDTLALQALLPPSPANDQVAAQLPRTESSSLRLCPSPYMLCVGAAN
jgi:hypothetical protein